MMHARRLAWLYYQNGDLATAAAAFKSLESQSKNGPFAVAALYWQARVTEKLGELESARQLHRQIIDGAAGVLLSNAGRCARWKRLGETVNEVKSNKAAVTPEADPPIAPDLMFHLTRARVLASLALRQLAVAELDAVDRRTANRTVLARFPHARVFSDGCLWTEPSACPTSCRARARSAIFTVTRSLLGPDSTESAGPRSRSLSWCSD